MPQSAAALPIAPEDLAILRGWSAATQAPAVQVQRARILLLAAKGVANSEIAERLGIARPTVIAWRNRYVGRGSSGGWPTDPAVAAPRPCAVTGGPRSWPRR
jgi:DNA invertase Pin-like site-specific DNA recombinase